MQIGVFTPLPPEKTGVAKSAFDIFSSVIAQIDFVSNFKNIFNYFYCLKMAKFKNISKFKHIKLTRKNYDKEIYVLGNSKFHYSYLLRAIKTKNNSCSRWISLAETQICGLLEYYCNKQKLNFNKLLKKYYPEKTEIIENLKPENVFETLNKNNIYGIRILADLTGVENFILYREYGKELFLKDLENSSIDSSKLNIKVVPMPIQDLTNTPKTEIKSDKKYIIGSFGIAHSIKQTDKIIDAVNLLNKEGKSVALLLAGYSLNKYLKAYDTTNIIAVENPTTLDLHKLMNSVDLAVQLRAISNGEGSGCICELIGLNKPFIATDNLLEPHFADFCTPVPSEITVADLAELIWTKLTNENTKNNADTLNQFSFEATAKNIMGEI